MRKLRLVLLLFVSFNWAYAQHFLKDSLEAQYNYETADSLYKLSRYKEAIDYITPVTVFYSKLKIWDKAIKSNILLIKNQLLLGQYNEAKKLCLNSLELNKQYLNDSISYDILLNSAGLIHMRLGDNYKSLGYFLQALDLKQHLYDENDASIALANNAISIVYKNIGLYQKALNHINKAIDIYVKSSSTDELELARYYNNIGDIYVEIGDYNLAAEYLTQSLTIYKQHFDTNKFTTSIVHLSLGIAYLKQKKYNIALRHTIKAHEIASAFLENSHPFLVYVQHNSALILLEKGNKEEARVLFLENRKILSKKLGNEHPQITKYNASIASSYMPDSLGLAIAYYTKAINLQVKLFGDKNPLLAAYYAELGEAYFKNNNHLEALEVIDKSIYSNIANEHILNKNELIKALQLKGQVLTNRDYKHDMDTALSLYLKCDSLITITRNEYQKYEDKLKLGETAKIIYQESIDLSYLLSKKNKINVKKGFRFSEKNKAIALLNAFSKRNVNLFSNIPDSILSIEKEVQIKISNLEIELYNEALGEDTNGKLSKIQNNLIDLRHAYNNINLHIEQAYPDYYQLKYNTKTATIEEVQTQIIDKDKVLIEYFTGDSSIYIFAITRSNYMLKKVSIDSSFYAHFNQFRNSLLSPKLTKQTPQNFNQYTSSAYNLYNYLLAPIKELIEGKDLIIIPDDQLALLPFEALLTKRMQLKSPDYKQLPYLLKFHAISYANSATTLLHSLQRADVSKSKRAVLAFAPSFDNKLIALAKPDTVRSSLGPLGWTEKEINSLASYFEVDTYLGKLATEKSFKENAGQYNIIHIASHGLIDDQNPMYSKIAFALEETDSINDGYLHTFELYNMQLNAKMAVLSACNTGYGKVQKGEGIMSLGYAFAYAGVPSVIISHWQVDDKSTYLLMNEFYKYLAEGMPKSVALQKAKLALLENENAAYANPYYWGAFVAYGNDEPIETKPNTWVWLLAVLLVISALSLLFFKRAN